HVDTSYNPDIISANFVSEVDNQYFPLVPGTTFHYLDTITEGTTVTKQDVAVTVTHDTKTILGIPCTVVHDVVTQEGTLVEDTWDWYTQDKDGNVWYFGEDTKKYEPGSTTPDTEGSWEAGVNNAKPGIIMYADPEAHVNMPYRQEYLHGVAEDKAEVLSISESITVPGGSFTNCVMTKDYSDIEPDVVEHKFFAPGVGQVSTITVQGGTEVEEFVSITTE
ncbi:MAG TPA: hypothetical protein VMU10_04245, partial [Desulfomonilia bacterium]|nr:hypothetical protein [Desulfomonilia bacterium]